MKKPLPKTASLDIELHDAPPALVGLVHAVAAAMEHQGASVDVDDLVCISGAAFSNYVFDPDCNRHEEEPREYSELAEYFSNYGPWESITYDTGWEIRELNALPSAEVLKVVAFELAAGRPIVTLDERLEPDIVVGYQISVDERLVRTARGTTFDLSEGSLQGDAPVFENWMLLVRPGERPEWAASTVRQRINVLRWAVEHSENHREFFQETRENYAPGLRGVQRFRAFLEDLTQPEAVAYAERYVARLAAARAAAGAVLPRWAGPIAEALGNDAIVGDLEEAAAHFVGTGEALSRYETMVDAFATVEENERAAMGALARAARFFPQAFEAL
jgi:hypothetical protein